MEEIQQEDNCAEPLHLYYLCSLYLGQSSGDTPRCDKGRVLSPERQVSQDSVFLPTTGNGGEPSQTQSLPPDALAGFRPLGEARKYKTLIIYL